MENSKTNTTPIDNSAEVSTETTQVETVKGNDKKPVEDTVTMSKTDYDKAIQAAEDRVRTKYSKSIKALEDKVAELTPVEKTEAEIELEKRLADIEQKEKENEAKEKSLNLKTSLQSHNIDVAIADYLSPDVDVEAFSADIEKLFTARLVSGGYKPSGHQAGQPISKDEYKNLSYDEMAELYSRDPETWKRLKN